MNFEGRNIVLFEKVDLIDEILRKDEPVPQIPRNFSTFDNFIQLVGLILLLVLILVAAYYVSKFFANIKIEQLKDGNIRIIDTFNLAPNKVLQIIQIGSKYILISINKDSINFMMELEEEDIIIKETENKNTNFKDIFDKFKKAKHDK